MNDKKAKEKDRRVRLIVKVASLLAFLLAWYLLVTIAQNNNFLRYHGIADLPTPVEAAEALADNFFGSEGIVVERRGIGEHSLASFKKVLIGFGIASALGVTIGITMGYLKYGTDVGGTIIEVLRPIPPLAWIPISIMIFRDNAPIFIVFLGCFFPIVLNTTYGVKSVDLKLMEAAKTLGGSSKHLITKVVLPWALPSIVTGMRIGLGIGWMSIVAAEMVGIKEGLGLGAFIWERHDMGHTDLVVAGMIMIGLIGWLMNFSIELVERKALKWKQMASG